MGAWEYTYLHANSSNLKGFTDKLDELGALGWELVGFASADKTIGLNSIMGILKRPLPVPGPPADDLTPGWKQDPTGRSDLRYWDGVRWSEHVLSSEREQGVDRPVMLPTEAAPAPVST